MSCTAWCKRPRKGSTPFFAAQSLWSGQALCLLDHGELPRTMGCAPAMGCCSTMSPRRVKRCDAQDHRGLARVDAGPTTSSWAISPLRDWGHARDYVEMQWLMLQQGNEDFVIATGRREACAASLSSAQSWLRTDAMGW